MRKTEAKPSYRLITAVAVCLSFICCAFVILLNAGTARSQSVSFNSPSREAKLSTSTSTSAPATPTSLEAESMATKTVGGVANGGTAWNLWSNGYVENPVQFSSNGQYTFQVAAAGTKALGISPKMQLRIDQIPAATVDVNTASISNYSFTVSVSAGVHRVAIAFINDYYDASTGNDRNLIVDKVAISNSIAGMWTASKFASGTIRGFGVGPITPQYMSDMAATKANLARKFVNLNRVSGTNTYTIDSSALTELDALVEYARQYKFKVVIVFEPLPNQTAQEYWDNPALQASIADNWKMIATRYKANPAIAGFDLINEPITKVAWDKGGQATWIRFASNLTGAIRSVDPNRLVIFEPSPGALPMGFGAMNEVLPYENVVYSTHVYQPHEFTHQGLYSYQTSHNYPGIWDSAMLSQHLDPVRQFVARFNKPIFVGEYSAVRWAPNYSAYNYVADAAALFEAEKWAWSYHAWREYQGWDAELPETWFYSFPYRDAKPQGFESVNQSTQRTGNTQTMLLLKHYFQFNTL